MTYKIHVLFALLSLTFSCNQEKKKVNEDKINSKNSSTNISTYQNTPERLLPIVDSIIKINIVEFEHITIAGFRSKNYQNFEELKKKSSTNELITLTNNKNTIVACYASWALADKSYSNLKSIFKNFLSQTRTVKTHSGCIISENHIASELYHRYWNNTNENDRENDKVLIELDSIILFQEKPDWLLLSRALEDRVYKGFYKQRIVELAFEKNNREALFYLNNWHKAEYHQEIKFGLLNYLQVTNFKNTGTSDYYNTVQELLRFNSREINDVIVNKLRTDKHWHHQPEKFDSLLEHYDIYTFSWSPN